METQGKVYFDILSKAANQINWLIFAILSICATNIFLLFNWHFGGLSYAIERSEKAEKNVSILAKDSLKHKNALKDYAKYYMSDSKAHISAVKNAINDRITNYKDIGKKTNTAQLPFIGIALTTSDFIIMYMVIGVVFLSWLTIKIKYAKETMKSLFNEFDASFDKSCYTLSDVFFMIYPNGTPNYKYLEALILGYLATIAALILSDVSDIVWKHGMSGEPLWNCPTFSIWHIPMIANFAITSSCFIICLFLFLKIKKDCKSIRNLLILMKWFDTAFLPVLKYRLDRASQSLVAGKNLFEYRTTNYTGTEQLYIKLVKTSNANPTEVTKAQCISVDFAATLQKFNKNFRYRTDNERNRLEQEGLTYETIEMREYFKMLSSENNQLEDKDYYDSINFLTS